VLDHLVFAAPDLAEAVAQVTELTGVSPVRGGSHVGLGTANYLAGLGRDAYLEIIGPDPDQPGPERPRPFGIDDLTGARLATWAVHAADLDGTISAARAKGYDPGEATGMSRRTGDGELLTWRLTPQGGLDGLAPFLIDWGSTPHPTSRDLPAIPLLMMTGVHPDPAAVHKVMDALGLEFLVRKDARPGLVAVLTDAGGRQVSLG
jgi:hypothetical protein